MPEGPHARAGHRRQFEHGFGRPYPSPTASRRNNPGAWVHDCSGGKGANQTVAAAKLGATVHMIGRMGSDDFGRALRGNIRAAGADDTYVAAESLAAIGIAIIEVEDSGQNTIVVAPGANACVTRADVDAARSVIATSKAIIAQLEIPLDTVQYALSIARAAHVMTILNPAPAQPLSTELLSLVDLLVPNESEAALLTGIEVKDDASVEAAARQLHDRGARSVVITLGERGALALSGEKYGAFHRSE